MSVSALYPHGRIDVLLVLLLRLRLRLRLLQPKTVVLVKDPVCSYGFSFIGPDAKLPHLPGPIPRLHALPIPRFIACA